MVQIFDWMREEIVSIANNVSPNMDKLVTLYKVEGVINQAEQKWEEDVCEWFKYDYRTIAPKNHDADNPYWRIPKNTDKLKYCPYCGKKIREVE